MGKVEVVGVINQRRERHKGKTFEEHKHKNEQVQKMPNKGVTLMRAHKWKDDKQIFRKGVMTKEQKKLKGTKGTNKRKKLKQLTSSCSKFLKDGLTQDDVENIHFI